jgi:hypothetical protein
MIHLAHLYSCCLHFFCFLCTLATSSPNDGNSVLQRRKGLKHCGSTRPAKWQTLCVRSQPRPSASSMHLASKTLWVQSCGWRPLALWMHCLSSRGAARI